MLALSASADVEMVQFFGLKLPAKKPVHQPVVDEEQEFEVIHVTNVALGENPADGPHVVKMRHGDQEVVLGTLQKGLVYQFPLDFCISQDVDFVNTGEQVQKHTSMTSQHACSCRRPCK